MQFMIVMQADISRIWYVFHEYFGKMLKLEKYGQMLMVFLENNRKGQQIVLKMISNDS